MKLVYRLTQQSDMSEFQNFATRTRTLGTIVTEHGTFRFRTTYCSSMSHLSRRTNLTENLMDSYLQVPNRTYRTNEGTRPISIPDTVSKIVPPTRHHYTVPNIKVHNKHQNTNNYSLRPPSSEVHPARSMELPQNLYNRRNAPTQKHNASENGRTSQFPIGWQVTNEDQQLSRKNSLTQIGEDGDPEEFKLPTPSSSSFEKNLSYGSTKSEVGRNALSFSPFRDVSPVSLSRPSSASSLPAPEVVHLGLSEVDQDDNLFFFEQPRSAPSPHAKQQPKSHSAYRHASPIDDGAFSLSLSDSSNSVKLDEFMRLINSAIPEPNKLETMLL